MAKTKAVDSVKVRMYRQGFGDCFLLSFFQSKSRVFTILIDCGIKYNTKSEQVPITDVIDDLKSVLTPPDGDKPYLDVLVATHEHWDHIAYFHPTRGGNKDFFADFDIGQVWLAWTENPQDKEAVVINSRLRQGVAALGFAAEQINEKVEDETEQTATFSFGAKVGAARKKFNQEMDDVMGFYGASTLSLRKRGSSKKESDSGIKYKENGRVSSMTELAMENIIKLGKNGIKYLSPGTSIDNTLLPMGVNICVLGPPRSSMINKSNPTHGHAQETYLGIDRFGMSSFIDASLALGAAANDKHYVDHSSPFGADEGLLEEDAQTDDFFQTTYFAQEEAYRKIQHNWLDITSQFALQLDGAINNTSLVLAIQLADSGKVLLFPGDAQVGSWLSWHDYQWEVKESSESNKLKTLTAGDLLKNTVLYKVSHHGSHNATVKEKGLELMKHPELVAMIPEKEDSYSGILYQPLVDRLNQLCKGRVLVSADKHLRPEDLVKNRPDELTASEWASFKKNLDVKPMYVEYTIKV